MIEPSNPFATYIAGLRAALGSREPFDVLREMPDKLQTAVSGLTPAQLATPEPPGKWSVLEVAQHLADSELVGAYRFRMILAHDRPPLTGYDQDAWATTLRYADANIDEAIEDFGRMRRANLRLLERLSAAERARVGLHTERGEESIEWMIANYAGHDITHLRQIERIRKALGA